MILYVERFWNGIFSFSEDITWAKIDYNKVEAGLCIYNSLNTIIAF